MELAFDRSSAPPHALRPSAVAAAALLLRSGQDVVVLTHVLLVATRPLARHVAFERDGALASTSIYSAVCSREMATPCICIPRLARPSKTASVGAGSSYRPRR